MRPRFELLDDDLAERIITEAEIVLAEVGVEINDAADATNKPRIAPIAGL
jgi:hypothetical protein